MSIQMGSRGENVRVLQQDLNAILSNERPSLVLDGVFGVKTKDRVCKFQRLNALKVDGIVGPKTSAKILEKKPRTPGAPPTPPGVAPNPNLPTSGMKFQNEMRQVFEQKGKTSQWMEFWNWYEQNQIPDLKTFLGFIGRAEDARTLAKFFIELRSWGFSAKEITMLFAKFNTMKGADAVKLFEIAVEPAGKFGKAVKAISDTAGRVGLVVTFVECAMHASRGDYSVIPAEIYKFGLGKMVPWAAMIEGLGSLLDGIVPEQTRKNSLLFKIMRSFDPIGLGAAGVDSLSAVVIGFFEMAVKGEVNVDILMPRLQRLVNRLKQGPTSVFAELGENSGDALYQLSQEGIDFEAIMRYSWMELKDFFGGN
ncbi:MAG: peptidoglycan-binding protein [Acidobacteriota bacterium]|nr:peptidoglycan-binding protein [Acidobacteriota bacterium]